MGEALTYAHGVWLLMGERRLGLIAAGVAFFSMLAIFPAVGALVSVVSFMADPVAVDQALAMADDFLPDDAAEILSDQVDRLTGAAGGALGIASIVSLLMALWSARLGVGALIQGMTAIYGAPPRSGIRGTILALVLTGVLMCVGAVAVIAILVAPVALSLLSPFLPGDSYLPFIIEVVSWTVALLALMAGLGIFYRYGPNRPKSERSPFLSYGLFLALFLWSLASIGFSIFLTNFGNYNEVYGSIGAVIALLMWLYISAYAVLIGAALNHVIEKAEYEARIKPEAD